MSTRPPELLYAVDERPPPTRLAALGLQYSVLIGIYLIFVVMVARAAKVPAQVIQDLVGLGFIAVAIGAFVQAYRGSLFGSGYLAPPLFSAIYVGPAIMAAEAGGLPAVAGLTIFAGLTEAVLSRPAHDRGLHRSRRGRSAWPGRPGQGARYRRGGNLGAHVSVSLVTLVSRSASVSGERGSCVCCRSCSASSPVSPPHTQPALSMPRP